MERKIKTIDEMLEETRQKRPEAYEAIMKEVETRKKKFEHGGKRQGAGRKSKEITKVTFTKRLLPETIAVLKDYAKEHDINETEALEIAISKLRQA